MSGRTWTIQYIRSEEVYSFEVCGWQCTPDLMDTHHGRYRQYIAKWDDGDGEPIYPEGEEDGN